MKYEILANGEWLAVERRLFDLWKGERRINGLPLRNEETEG